MLNNLISNAARRSPETTPIRIDAARDGLHAAISVADEGRAGPGGRFTFTLPAAAEADGNESARPASSGPDVVEDQAGRPRILVLDDDPQTLHHIRDVLLAAGYAPLVTADPADLPRLLRTEKPQLVLLDLMLPGADGIELLERTPGLADLPVIFISGYGRDETISRALEAGAADYIVKPFSPTELTARVRAALRLRARPASYILNERGVGYRMPAPSD